MKKIIFLYPSPLLLVACTGVGESEYSANQLHGGMSQSPSMLHHSKDNKGSHYFPTQRPATGNKVVVFDPKATAWAAYDASGHRVKTGRASGGKGYCADVGRPCRTTTGTYRIYSKKGADCKSSKYPVETGGGAPMPYCMHFNGGYALHGSYNVPDYNASHGCIRVTPSAARWLNQDFVNVGTTLIVKSY